MSAWTTDRVLALAPDESSAAAGQGLASPRKWSGLGKDPGERAVWGLCQGSGKSPYQVRIDLAEPAFKCSCPSRKFPCKHGLGLFLMFAKGESAIKPAAQPAWVSEWIETRAEKAEKKAAKAGGGAEPADPKPVDVEARARRAAQRERRVRDGVAECRVWLNDLVRRGLAEAQREPGSFWERAAARMVDAQAPGLARLIRELPGVMASGEGWPRRTLDRLGRLHLVLRAADRLADLPETLAGDVRVALGWTQTRDEALGGEALADSWATVGQVIEDEERLRVRRTWLVGRNTGRIGLVLDFSAGGAPFDPSLVAGTEFEGALAFYPSGVPLRAVVKNRAGATAGFKSSPGGPGVASSFETTLGGYAKALATCPWIDRWPLIVSGITPTLDGARWLVVDASGEAIPVRPGSAGVWRVMALSGGRPIGLMGEWDGEFLLPLSTWSAGGAVFTDVAPRWAA